MNIAVIKLRDIIKYIVCIILIIATLSIGISIIKKEETSFIQNIKDSSFLYCLKSELAIISLEEEQQKETNDKSAEKIISTELAIMENIEAYSEEDDTEIEEIEETDEEETEEIAEENIIEEGSNSSETTVETEVILANNINASYTNETGTVKINNQTSYDISGLLSNSNYEITNKDKIVIYHTHTCESYTSSDAYTYEMTGNYRTTDLNYTVSRVGDELASYLESYGKTVIHDKTYHDYPAYNGSYGRSLTTLQSILESNSDSEIVIDLHRDAVRK